MCLALVPNECVKEKAKLETYISIKKKKKDSMACKVKSDRLLPPAREAAWFLKPLSELGLPGFACRVWVRGSRRVVRRGGITQFMRASLLGQVFQRPSPDQRLMFSPGSFWAQPPSILLHTGLQTYIQILMFLLHIAHHNGCGS